MCRTRIEFVIKTPYRTAPNMRAPGSRTGPIFSSQSDDSMLPSPNRGRPAAPYFNLHALLPH